jgi:uncharacterized membrane protein HdeD (DUF308 family)
VDRISIVLVRGGVTVAMGMLALVWPGLTVVMIISAFGIYAIADGLIDLAMGAQPDEVGDRAWFTVLEGVINIGVGVVALASPETMLWPMLPAWALVTGALEVAAAMTSAPQSLAGEWLLLVGGIAAVILSVALFAVLPGDPTALAWSLGSYAVAKGLLLAVAAFTVRVGRLLA